MMKLKKAAPMGIIARKIIVVPCIVKSWLNTSGLTMSSSDEDNCTRIINASMPPTTNMTKAVTP